MVTTAAYRPPDLARFEPGRGEAVRRAIEAAQVPEPVADAVRAAYRELGGGAVAVRSSATAEDLPEATFAGQQDTFLHVVGEREVLDAVRRCWASLWTDRAIDYRDSHGIDHGRAKIAVVVQRMVAAEFAGVAFTSDPVTGDRHTMVIDANPGLGEAVVSGLVTPEHLVVGKRRSRVIDHRSGRHEVVVRPRPEGGTERVTEPPPDTELPAHAVRRLVGIAKDIERHFGRPQDIEWAWAGGEMYVLQTRPITALPAQPASPGRVRRAMAGMLAEIVPVRPYPIDLTAWAAPLLGSVGKLIEAVGVAMPPLDRFFVEEDDVVVRVDPPLPRLTWRVLTAPLHFVRTARHYDPARWRSDPVVGTVRGHVREWRARDIGGASWPELLALLDEGPTLAARALELRLRYFPRTVLALAGLFVVLSVLRRRRLMGALLSGVDTLTTDANRALEDLAATIRADAGLAETFVRHGADELYAALARSAPAFLVGFDAFLDRYGHRDMTTPLLVTQPTWRDRPDVVLGLLKGLAADPPPPLDARPAERAERELFAHPLLRRGPAFLRTTVRALLRQARWFQQVRDDTRFLVVLPLPTMRWALLEMGGRLVAAGVLDAPEDAFHLRLDELRRLAAWPPTPALRAELHERVTRRRAHRARLAGTPLVRTQRIGEVGGDEVDRDRGRDRDRDVVLRGTPGSAGLAEGPVRVVHGVEEFGSLRNGEVLVARYTSPAWTPLFRRAAAVVVDTGGVASHAAIVAREYGIPAVMATVHATTRLADGQRVRVDGDRGVVLPAE
ncbi:PEP/pyruvate-binding domain-containing protein [Streptomyces chattanoogensis]|uniref:PEP/pyruvate-binding domain-containing protein n=1 Tax=Streptomyces chattanoogensis TaxID=66876 RepID=UPI0036BB4388